MNLFLAVIIGNMSGFLLGWIARRHDGCQYLQSRERYWTNLLAVAISERDEALSQLGKQPAPVQQQPPAVVNVHVHSSLPQSWSQPTIDGQIIRESPNWSAIESGVA